MTRYFRGEWFSTRLSRDPGGDRGPLRLPEVGRGLAFCSASMKGNFSTFAAAHR